LYGRGWSGLRGLLVANRTRAEPDIASIAAASIRGGLELAGQP
jgi:hypothetical protein